MNTRELTTDERGYICTALREHADRARAQEADARLNIRVLPEKMRERVLKNADELAVRAQSCERLAHEIAGHIVKLEPSRKS